MRKRIERDYQLADETSGREEQGRWEVVAYHFSNDADGTACRRHRMQELLSLRTLGIGMLLLSLLPGFVVLPSSVPAQTQSTTAMGERELGALLGPIFAEQMEKLHIPGAVVVVVKDGRIVFSRGYGYADIEKKTPVVPETTIFRIGSITKVFSALAVMTVTFRSIRVSPSSNER